MPVSFIITKLKTIKMKHLLITAIIFTAFSCKKDVKCTCTVNGQTETIVVKNTTKKAAEKGPCASYSRTYVVTQGTSMTDNVQCKIKD